jgi:photosystem II stability/assembly factor-like uncharacterized protein
MEEDTRVSRRESLGSVRGTPFLLALSLVVALASCRAAVRPASPTSSSDDLLVGLRTIDVGKMVAFTATAVLKTVDGGETWSDISPMSHPPVRGLFFLDSSNGWLATSADDRAQVYRTTDGGRSWEINTLSEAYPDGFGTPNFAFLDRLHGWVTVPLPTSAAFAVSRVYHTTDGGQSWNEEQQPVRLDGPIAFSTESTGWAPGDAETSSVYQTTDGGKTWKQRSLPVPGGYEADRASFATPVFFDGTRGVIEQLLTGQGGDAVAVDVTADGGDTWLTTSALPLPTGYESGAVPPFSAVDEAHWFVATSEGLVATEDGGTTWTPVSSDIGFGGVASLQFSSPQSGSTLISLSSCAQFKADCSTATTLYSTDDGGARWTPVTP